MTISQRIFTILKQKHLKQKDLADYSGISTSAISAWNKNNTNPAAESLSIIADFLGVSLEYLITGQENTNKNGVDDIDQLIANYASVDEISKKLILERAETLAELATERAAEQEKKEAVSRADELPAPEELVLKSALTAPRTKKGTIKITYFDYSASAGTGLFLDETKSEKITVLNTFEAQNADYAIPVCGDSMEDEIHDGDIVLVESCPCVRKGEVGIFLLDGEVFIKEYGGDRLISYNEKYKPILLRKYEFAACLGRVLGIAQQVIK